MTVKHSPPEARLGYQLWQAQHAVERALDEALRPIGIALTQVAALLHLQRQPGLSGAELARRLLITPQSTATLLGALEARGFIARTPHAVHRTLIEVRLTESGLAKLREGLDIITRVDAAISEGMSAGERAQLSDLLARTLAAATRLTGESEPTRRRRK